MVVAIDRLVIHLIFLLLNALWSSLLGIGHLGLALIDGTPGEFRFSGLSQMDCILPSDAYIDQDSHNHSFFTPCMKASELDWKNKSTCSNLGLQWSKGGQNCVFLFSKVFRCRCCRRGSEPTLTMGTWAGETISK